MVSELFNALTAAGVEKDVAQKAAESVFSIENADKFATKADLTRLEFLMTQKFSDVDTKLSQLEARLIKWNVGAIIAMTAVFASIIKFL